MPLYDYLCMDCGEVCEILVTSSDASPECTACGRCVGVCPTGALDPVETDQQPPSFSSRLCVDCGSCEAFCRNEGVRLTRKNQDAA